MRTIMLEFLSREDLDQLLNDHRFQQEIGYLRPNRLDTLRIVLSDPIQEHSQIDSEVVVLSVFASAIKRILFPNSDHDIEFLNPYVNVQKGGLRHDNQIIINSTTVQIA